MRFSFPRRDDPNSFASQRIGDKQQSIFHDAKHGKALLVKIVAVVDPFNRERIPESLAGHLKADAVLEPIVRSLASSHSKLPSCTAIS
jgi:hypothetical protein